MKKDDVKKLEEYLQKGYWFWFSVDDEIHQLRFDINDGNPVGFASYYGQNVKNLLLRAEDSENGVEKDRKDYTETDLNLDILLRRGFWIYIQNIKTKSQHHYLLSILPTSDCTAPAVYKISTKAENGFVSLLKRAEYEWAQYITKKMKKDNNYIGYCNSYSELKPEDRFTL